MGSEGTWNLNGGTFSVQAISRGQGSGTFSFNSGTLKPIAHNVDLMSGLTAANVQAGGATIDTGGCDIAIALVILLRHRRRE